MLEFRKSPSILKIKISAQRKLKLHIANAGPTCPPLASMLTQMVLVGRDEFSRQDRHSPVYAYLESFFANTYTVFVAIFSCAIKT